jgi:hypothetical protein
MKDLISMGSLYKAGPPQLRAWHGVSPRKKLEIVLFFLHHRIEEPEVRQGLKQKQRCLKGLEWDGEWRPPTAKEAGIHFKVPESTARDIWNKRYSVVQLSRSCRRDTSGAAGEKHPELELELFRQFIEWRQMGRKISRFWFQRRARLLYRALYNKDAEGPTQVSLYTLFCMVVLTHGGRIHLSFLLAGFEASAVAGTSRGGGSPTLASTYQLTTLS